jgi:hypothetical protein
MNKLKLCLAALITASAFFSCGGGEGGILTGGGEGYAPPDGTVNTDIVITFQNGWESVIDPEQLKNDPFTDYDINKALTPAKTNAVVNKAEMDAYTEQLASYKAIKDKWDAYQELLDAYNAALASGSDDAVPPPPQTKPSRRNLLSL